MRLIDAELLWYGLAGIHVRTNGMCKTTELEKLLNNAPTVDSVTVVRCKDCVEYNRCTCDGELIGGTCSIAKNVWRKPDDYCSRGIFG